MKILLILITLILTAGQTALAIERSFSNSELEATLNLNQAVILGTDSLWLSDKLLIRGVDYKLNSLLGRLKLLVPTSADDTLLVHFTPMPGWLTKSFGRLVPSIGQTDRPAKVDYDLKSEQSKRQLSDISISGSKSFKITSRSVGTADFSQTLDMKISGELSEGLFISGNVTDRDVDPTYGTVNSRLSELDRMNIRIYSAHFESEIGDLLIGKQYGLKRSQRMTGLGFWVEQPKWSLYGVVARPRGEFKTVKISGLNGLQGPYQINQTGSVSSVVPGSETIWLDGQLLQRGTDKDYQIDYSLSRLTFNVNHPIDSRSRIEIDFEPQLASYKKQLISGGGTTRTSDSSFYFGFGFLREGDDTGQPLFGELTETEKALLASSGDSTVWVNSIVADSLGNYILLTDSLPDSVYQWIENNGDYKIGFTYLGPGQGDYDLIGNGVYQFVGQTQGGYLPLKKIDSPKQTTYYKINAGLSNSMTGNFDFSWQTSVYDQNLLSSLNDKNNRATLIDLTNSKSWVNHNRPESVKLRYRFRETGYQTRERLYKADFNRQFYLPLWYLAQSDEHLTETKLKLQPVKNISLETEYRKLLYENSFESDFGEIKLQTNLSDQLAVSFGWQGVNSTLDSLGSSLVGQTNNWRSDLTYQLGNDWQIKSYYESDDRKNRYKTVWQGTRFNQLGLEAGKTSEALKYEYYQEDSLSDKWAESLTRQRLSFHSNRKINNLNYNLTLTQQWLESYFENQKTKRDDFLGRLKLRYHNQSAGLNSSASYLISNEVRNARGLIYLEVATGEGDFILDEEAPGGPQYIPDDQGNYIRLEEVLSQSSEVKRGERSFLFSKTGDGWRFRFDSRHLEELLSSGQRSLLWAIPFLVDESQEYLFFNGRHSLDIKAIDQGGFYLLNFSGTRQVEKRLIGTDSPNRETLALEFSLKQKTGTFYLEEAVNLFRTDRDNYYSGIGVVNGYQLKLKSKKKFSGGEAGFGVGQRVARSEADTKVVTYLLDSSLRVQILKKGSIKGQLEYYSNHFTNQNGEASYQLTDNRAGLKGASWSLSLQYGLKKDLRTNLTISGKHSDNRSGRVLARGELIATF